MKRIAMRALVFSLPAFPVAFAVTLLQPSTVLARDQEVRVIELAARKYEYSGSSLHVKAGTKVQLKITATDHDHGFKIATIPDGVDSNGSSGLVFAWPQDCWQLKRERQRRLSFWRKRPVRIRLGAAIFAAWAIEA